ncbi:hypothetical protein SB5439_04981 [Klebsiella variicola]|uniref:C40 family peptidase n=1 Tax=Klebsiella variicola TaxID=244366 RepID=UPI0010DA0EB0|nr:hypothetical protein SB5439_04981 [Klebsiella variicola]
MDQNIIDAIFRHAKEEYPRECCGVVVQKSRVKKYFRCKNITQNPTEQFEIDPEDYADAEDWGTVTHIVHSHPGDGASPIPSDLDYVQCDAHSLPWIIVSWPGGEYNIIEPRGDRPLTGRPFVLGYADCWSLIREWHSLRGVDLKNYSVPYAWWEKGENLYLENWESAGFVEVETPRPGDMVMMRIGSDVVNHAGILLEDNYILHHLYGRLSCEVPYSQYWRDRTEKIVRHKDLKDE